MDSPTRRRRQRRSWAPPAAGFRLPNGSSSMGRPDIVLLLAGGDVAALTARQVTARAAEARAGSASPGGRKPAAAGGSPDGSPAASPVKALLGLDVPSAMVGSELSRLAKMSAGVPRVEAEGPADRPARPESSRGAYRLRDNLLALRAAELHTAVQRPPTAPGAGGAGEPAPLTAPAAAFAGAGAAGGGSPTRAFVRVGASAAAAVSSVVAAAAADAGGAHVGYTPAARGGGPTSRPPTRTSFGGGGAPAALTAGTTRVSLANATTDLPTAAVGAVRRMLAAGATVTVAAIHQRRPPHYAQPGARAADEAPRGGGAGGGARDFLSSLRGGDYESAVARPAFRVGCPPPWLKGRNNTNVDFDTFDFVAQTTGYKYFVSDFSQPARAGLRPPTPASTRPAANVPSMVARAGAEPAARLGALAVPLVDVRLAGEDSAVRMRHADEGVPLKRALPPRSLLIPYRNDATRATTMATIFLANAKIVISLAGTDVPIYLLDDSALVIKVTPATTAGGAIVTLRKELGLALDAHYSVYEHYDAHFRLVEDSTQLAKLLQKWPQASPFGGPRRLYLKRALRVPDCALDAAELASPPPGDAAPLAGAPRLAYADAVFHVLHGHYRFDVPIAAKLAALQLYAARGPAGPRDAPARLAPLVDAVLPAYALASAPRDGPSAHGVGLAPGAFKDAAAAADAVVAEYRALGAGLSRAEAAHALLALCKEHPCYGYEFFLGRRTWKEAGPPAPDGGPGKEVARSEDVVACAGHEGVFYLSKARPLDIVTHDYAEITRWSVSRDGRIFAFSTEDGGLVYIVTDLAPHLERAVERYVAEKVAAVQADEAGGGGGGGGGDRSARGRGEREFGAPPAFARAEPPPPSPAAASPWPLPPGAGLLEDFDPAALPPGWLELRDADGEAYYLHEPTGRRTWEHPAAPRPPLPPGWVEALDPASGEPYYYAEDESGARVGEPTWERPPPYHADVEPPDVNLAPGWVVARDAEGDAYFYHAASRLATWDKPRDPRAPPLEEVALRGLTPRAADRPAGGAGAADARAAPPPAVAAAS